METETIESLIDTFSPSKCLSSYERIIYAYRNGFQHFTLEYGPVKLNLSDMCTLLPPGHIITFKEIKSAVQKDFVPGWLIDKVVTFEKFCQITKFQAYRVICRKLHVCTTH